MVLQNDLSQNGTSHIVAGRAVANVDGLAFPDHCRDFPQRHITSLAPVVKSAIGVADDSSGFRVGCSGASSLFLVGHVISPEVCGSGFAEFPICADASEYPSAHSSPSAESPQVHLCN